MNSYILLRSLLKKLEGLPDGYSKEVAKRALQTEIKKSLENSGLNQLEADNILRSCQLLLERINSYLHSVRDGNDSGSEVYLSPLVSHKFLSFTRRPRCSFSSIPGDILFTIFHLVLDQLDCNKTRFAIALSGINRKCREVVMTTPSFWNTLISDLSPQLARISLERSSRSSLSLHIGAHPSRLDAFFELIKLEYDRFSSITFYDVKGWRAFMLCFKGMSMTALRKLVISKIGTLEEDYKIDVFETLHMPNLTCYDGPWFKPNKDASWEANLNQISFYVFSFGWFTLFDVLKTLVSCQFLELRFPHQDYCIHRDNNLDELEIYNTSSEEDRMAGLPPSRPVRRSYNEGEDSESDDRSDEFDDDGNGVDINEDGDDGDNDIEDVSGGDTTGENVSEENVGQEEYIEVVVHSREGAKSKLTTPMLRHLVLEIQCGDRLRLAERLIYDGHIPLHQITSLKIVLKTNARDETFQDMFRIADFNNLESFEVNYAEEGESPPSFSLRGMPVLEDLIIEGATGLATVEGYMFDAKTLTTVKRIKLWDCDIHEESIVSLAKILADPLRLHPFELLRLHDCRLAPSALHRLRSILPRRKFDFVLELVT